MIGFLQQTSTTTTPVAPVTATVETTPGAAVVVAPDATHAVVVPDATHAVVAHDAVPAAAHAAPTGMPQLDISTFGNQIFWLLVAIALIYWVLSRIALPRIAAVLADRQGAITGDLGAAEEFKRRARDAEAAYEAALAQARGEANGIVAENRARMQAELDTAIAHADAEIAARAAESEGRITAIRDRSQDDARSVARDVTEALLSAFGGRADAAQIDAAVDQRLKGAAR